MKDLYKLIQIANELDKRGLTKTADYLDKCIQKLAQPFDEDDDTEEETAETVNDFDQYEPTDDELSSIETELEGEDIDSGEDDEIEKMLLGLYRLVQSGRLTPEQRRVLIPVLHRVQAENTVPEDIDLFSEESDPGQDESTFDLDELDNDEDFEDNLDDQF